MINVFSGILSVFFMLFAVNSYAQDKERDPPKPPEVVIVDGDESSSEEQAAPSFFKKEKSGDCKCGR